jgi:hypothetical protein
MCFTLIKINMILLTPSRPHEDFWSLYLCLTAIQFTPIVYNQDMSLMNSFSKFQIRRSVCLIPGRWKGMFCLLSFSTILRWTLLFGNRTRKRATAYPAARASPHSRQYSPGVFSVLLARAKATWEVSLNTHTLQQLYILPEGFWDRGH